MFNHSGRSSSHRSSLFMQNVASFVLCLSVTLTMLVGCSPSDAPKIVAADHGMQGAVKEPVRRPTTILINTALDGATMLCADYQLGPTWLNYGPKGQVTRIDRAGIASAGFRFELGSFVTGNHRAGLQFAVNEMPTLYKWARSDGRTAELLNNENTNAPAMRCFRKLPENFLWIDFTLTNELQYMPGNWACNGPLGNFALNEEGAINTGQGLGQTFVWGIGDKRMMTVFWAGALQFNGLQQYDKFIDAELHLSDLANGQFTYDAIDSTGQVARHACSKQAITQPAQN